MDLSGFLGRIDRPAAIGLLGMRDIGDRDRYENTGKNRNNNQPATKKMPERTSINPSDRSMRMPFIEPSRGVAERMSSRAKIKNNQTTMVSPKLMPFLLWSSSLCDGYIESLKNNKRSVCNPLLLAGEIGEILRFLPRATMKENV